MGSKCVPTPSFTHPTSSQLCWFLDPTVFPLCQSNWFDLLEFNISSMYNKCLKKCCSLEDCDMKLSFNLILDPYLLESRRTWFKQLLHWISRWPSPSVCVCVCVSSSFPIAEWWKEFGISDCFCVLVSSGVTYWKILDNSSLNDDEADRLDLMRRLVERWS